MCIFIINGLNRRTNPPNHGLKPRGLRARNGHPATPQPGGRPRHGEALQRFDTDGTPLVVADDQAHQQGATSSRSTRPPTASPPWNATSTRVPGAGKTYCPLDRNARIVGSSTPGSPR